MIVPHFKQWIHFYPYLEVQSQHLLESVSDLLEEHHNVLTLILCFQVSQVDEKYAQQINALMMENQSIRLQSSSNLGYVHIAQHSFHSSLLLNTLLTVIAFSMNVVGFHTARAKRWFNLKPLFVAVKKVPIASF